MRYDKLTTKEDRMEFMNSSDKFYLVTHFPKRLSGLSDEISDLEWWQAEEVSRDDFSKDGTFPPFYYNVDESVLFNDLNEMDEFLHGIKAKGYCNKIDRFGCNF